MIKLLNKKLLMLLFILALGLYLIKNPIEHLTDNTNIETNISILTQILQSDIKNLNEKLDKHNEEILELKILNKQNTKTINNIQSDLNLATDIINE